MLNIDIDKYTDIGRRNENQDSFSYKLLPNNIFIGCIADGVGGKYGGSLASKTSVDIFIDELSKEEFDLNRLYEIPSKINTEILKLAKESELNKNMATTFSGIVIRGNRLEGVHIGDTRACILRGNGIKQLTRDHTEVARLVREGKLTFKESLNYPRRNVIEKALGMKKGVEINKFGFDLIKGDRIILTTDGVHEVVSKRNLRDMSILCSSPREFLTVLINYLKTQEPSDNNTIMVIDIN